MSKHNTERNGVLEKRETAMEDREGVGRHLPGKANRHPALRFRFRSWVKCPLPSKALPDLSGGVVPFLTLNHDYNSINI